MSTIEPTYDFTAFAADRLNGADESTIEDLFEAWRGDRLPDVDAAAVMASVRDLESGRRGQPFGELLAEFDAEQAEDLSLA